MQSSGENGKSGRENKTLLSMAGIISIKKTKTGWRDFFSARIHIKLYSSIKKTNTLLNTSWNLNKYSDRKKLNKTKVI